MRDSSTVCRPTATRWCAASRRRVERERGVEAVGDVERQRTAELLRFDRLRLEADGRRPDQRQGAQVEERRVDRPLTRIGVDRLYGDFVVVDDPRHLARAAGGVGGDRERRQELRDRLASQRHGALEPGGRDAGDLVADEGELDRLLERERRTGGNRCGRLLGRQGSAGTDRGSKGERRGERAES